MFYIYVTYLNTCLEAQALHPFKINSTSKQIHRSQLPVLMLWTPQLKVSWHGTLETKTPVSLNETINIYLKLVSKFVSIFQSQIAHIFIVWMVQIFKWYVARLFVLDKIWDILCLSGILFYCSHCEIVWLFGSHLKAST